MDTACTRCKAELSAFIDNEIESDVRGQLEGHLSSCNDCNQEYERLRGFTRFLVNGLNPDKMETPDIWEAIKDELPSICELMQEDLSAYLDGELTASAQEGVNKHLKECSACLESFRLMNAANRLISKGLELPEAQTVDLWSSIKSRLNEDCAIIEGELSAFADQEVVPLRHRAITVHLTECESCRVKFNRLASVGDLIRDSYKPVMADDFDLWPDIKRKLQVVPFAARQRSKARQLPQRAYITAVAAAVVGLTGIFSVVLLNQPKDNGIKPMSSEAYLIESALAEPADIAEAVIYDQQ